MRWGVGLRSWGVGSQWSLWSLWRVACDWGSGLGSWEAGQLGSWVVRGLVCVRGLGTLWRVIRAWGGHHHHHHAIDISILEFSNSSNPHPTLPHLSVYQAWEELRGAPQCLPSVNPPH